jgi:hypothetical protein
MPLEGDVWLPGKIKSNSDTSLQMRNQNIRGFQKFSRQPFALLGDQQGVRDLKMPACKQVVTSQVNDRRLSFIMSIQRIKAACPRVDAASNEHVAPPAEYSSLLFMWTFQHRGKDTRESKNKRQRF